MKVVVMVDRSAGNESVGDMWTETKVFEDTATLKDVYGWITHGVFFNVKPENVKANIRLSVAQE